MKGPLSLFIVFHVSAFLAWSMPESNLLIQAYSDSLTPYMMSTGLWQGWSMFAPNSRSIISSVDAVVEFADGETRTWTIPRVEMADVSKRPALERWGQWGMILQDDENDLIRPDAARYIARLHYDPENATNPPVRVQLWWHWTQIPAPKAHQPRDRTPTQKEHFENHEILLSYDVREEDLQ